jgi:hypothetical protein
MMSFDEKDSEEVRIEGTPLRCLVCRHDQFWQRNVEITPIMAELFSLEEVRTTVACYICNRCGHIHWFMPQR